VGNKRIYMTKYIRSKLPRYLVRKTWFHPYIVDSLKTDSQLLLNIIHQKMDSSDFFGDSKMVMINSELQSFVAGLVFGINIAMIVTVMFHVFDWCHDPLAAKLQERISELETENQEFSDKIDELMEEKEKLEKENLQLKDEIESLDDDQEDLHELLDEKDAKIKTLNDKIENLRDAIRLHKEVYCNSEFVRSSHKRPRSDIE
jgi:myosin heavy subunit